MPDLFQIKDLGGGKKLREFFEQNVWVLGEEARK